MALAELADAQLSSGHLKEGVASANRANQESSAQFTPEFKAMAQLAQARAALAGKKNADAQKLLLGALQIAESHRYLPLAMEMRIELATATATGDSKHRQLAALIDEANSHGWKRIAARARREALVR